MNEVDFVTWPDSTRVVLLPNTRQWYPGSGSSAYADVVAYKLAAVTRSFDDRHRDLAGWFEAMAMQ